MNEPGVRTIDTIAAEINGIKEQVRATVVSGAIEIGRRLKEAKSLVPYGEWGAWLERSVDYSERTAQNMMRIADEYGKTDPQALADLSVTQAVLLLGVPAEERGAFLAENDVPSMSTRELQAQIEARRSERWTGSRTAAVGRGSRGRNERKFIRILAEWAVKRRPTPHPGCGQGPLFPLVTAINFSHTCINMQALRGWRSRRHSERRH